MAHEFGHHIVPDYEGDARDYYHHEEEDRPGSWRDDKYHDHRGFDLSAHNYEQDHHGFRQDGVEHIDNERLHQAYSQGQQTRPQINYLQ